MPLYTLSHVMFRLCAFPLCPPSHVMFRLFAFPLCPFVPPFTCNVPSVCIPFVSLWAPLCPFMSLYAPLFPFMPFNAPLHPSISLYKLLHAFTRFISWAATETSSQGLFSLLFQSKTCWWSSKRTRDIIRVWVFLAFFYFSVLAIV